jgi:Carboxypeptidase regulatory-like domain/TonB dependent receptor-like, beta-barrel
MEQRRSVAVCAGIAFLLVLGCGAAPLGAQTARGTILGNVKDTSGAVIPGATMTYTNVATGITGTFATTSSGDYVFVNLNPGSYDVKCEKSGFKAATASHLILQVDHTLRQDFTLEVGATTEKVTVSAAAQMVQTDNTTIGGVVSGEMLQALPLNGRDFTNLIALNAGVTQPSGGIQTSVFDQHGLNDSWRAFSVNGARPASISYLIDGITDNDAFFSKATSIPSQYSLQEFKLQNGLYSAEYGPGSAQVNVAIRSGANAFHGNAYDFLRNAAFAPDNALNKFLNAQNGSHLPLSDPLKQQNQFGATIGGPIRHDKAFFFASYEGGRRNTGGGASSLMVPTDLERSGNFSDWPYPIYDPSTSVVSGSPPKVSRTAFANNTISSGISPIATKLMDYYPHANVSCTMPCLNFSAANPASKLTTNTVTGRVDYNLSDRDRLYFTMVQWRDSAPNPSVIPINGTVVFTRSQLYGLNWEHSFTPTIVNEARVGYNRMFYHNGVASAYGPDLSAQLGLKNTPGVTAFYNIPLMAPTQGYAGIGAQNNYTQKDNIFEYADDLKFTHGKHTIAVGTDIRRFQLFDIDGFTAEGKLTFNGEYTGIDPKASAAGKAGPTAGNAIADLLLGDPSLVNGAPAPIASDLMNLRGTSISLYAQDDYRVTPRLTINLGLRWELPAGLYSVDNSGKVLNLSTPGGGLIWASHSFVNQVAPALTSAQQATYMQCCVTNQLVPRDTTDFAPRIGFAWRPLSTDRFVVRGGYGIFYDTYMRFYDTTNYDSNSLYTLTPPPYPTATGLESVSPLALSGLWLPPITGNPFPTLLKTPYLYGPQVEWPGNHTPYTQQWGLDTQYAFNQNLMLDVGYVGSHSIHQPIQWHYNEAYAPPVAGDTCNYLQDASQATGGNAACATDPNFVPIDQRAPFANFYTRSYANANILSSYYNALQVRLTQRFYHGLTFVANYTYSKAMDMSSEIAPFSGEANFVQDAHNLRADYGPADFDQTHRFTLGYAYNLPWGRGREHSLGRVGNWTVGGWNASGTVTLASGLPETVFCCTRSADQFGNLFGNRIRANVSGSPTAGITQNVLEWINPAVYSVPVPGTYGNGGRNTVRVPGQRQADIAFVKQFPIRERQNLEYRLEVFNLFSSTRTGTHFFGNVVTSSPANCKPGPSGNCSFGALVPLNGAGALNWFNPRIIQMALVYSF